MSSKKIKQRTKLNKSNSKKAMKFKTSPLIPVIAVLEVIILIVMSTYAWFATTQDKNISTNLISVDPDSGLEIDFYQADRDFIKIENYLHDFKFVPATSIDGKNIFFPTTGTFNSTDTNKMVFREGTVNDINSKYISINFSLTNTDPNGNAKTVSLSNKSYFKIKDDLGDFSGKALRMALYQNDGTAGAVRSTNMAADGNSKKTIFFRNNLGWESPHIYVWDNNNQPISGGACPGFPMSKLGRDIYYFTFDSRVYSNFLFDNGASNSWNNSAMRQTVDIKKANTTAVKSGTIYSIGSESNQYNGSNKKYYVNKDETSYANLGIIDDEILSYPVISPGVSAGFQRQYSPVVSINSAGSATEITPAFASSFDDYLYGNLALSNNTVDRTLFTINPGETKDLSLIIWLEGTDPDCTVDTYAGNKVEMNFVFSVGDNEDDTYIYRFYDQTKESWTEDSQTYYGVKYDPVIQLYDETEHRGYKMTYNSNGKYWQCTAPADLVSDYSNHEINFRRVNPWDEDMVWNYWYAGSIDRKMQKYAKEDLQVDRKDVYSFTAFANGGPESYIDNATQKTVANPIQHSCGGVWGKETNAELITFVDCTKSHWVHDSNLSGTSGTVTIKYTYNDQTVEYASSYADNSTMYYFVVPKNVYNGANRPSVTFRRYYNFVTESITAINNKEQNPNLTYHNEWSAGQIDGRVFEFGQKDTDSVNNCNWKR